ncbi:zinc finger, CCHC-type containing protein [Tanacetum coccineum]
MKPSDQWRSPLNSEDNSSTSDWVFLLGGAAGKEAEWLRNLILEILLWSKPITPISIHCDSDATLAKAYTQMYNGMSRHLGVRHNMIRELITNGVVSIEFAMSQQNLADHLTKGLARDLILKSAEGMRLKYSNELKVQFLEHLDSRIFERVFVLKMVGEKVVKVGRDEIAACMTCPICDNLFRCATTIPECLHTLEGVDMIIAARQGHFAPLPHIVLVNIHVGSLSSFSYIKLLIYFLHLGPHPVCRKCIRKKFIDEELECCPICNIDLGCAPLEKLSIAVMLLIGQQKWCKDLVFSTIASDAIMLLIA